MQRAVRIASYALAVSIATFVSIDAKSAELPKLGEQIDATPRPLGTGNCKTTRTGVWRVEGGVVVQILKPIGNCGFESLELVVGQERIKFTAADDSFYFGKQGNWGPRAYWWYRGNSGNVFFATKSVFDASDIKGIMEVGCTTASCLNEEGAQ